MCGIAGFSGRFTHNDLVKMSEKISHRGPDGDGVVFLPEPKIGLAHRRLSIIDLSTAGAQPMWDANKKVCIVFNGEIYNFQSLRRELETEGETFRGYSDTEVILTLYLRYGEKMLTRLNGIFAFAIWDSRNGFLFLARDGMGVKPLYFSPVSAGFLFASEIKALLQAAEVSRDVDATALRHYLTYLWCPAPRTMLQAVRKLEPGCALLVKDGRIVRKWQFYELPLVGKSVATFSEKDAIEQVKESVREAVHRQMVSDVPVGAFLSGGLDSSAVVAFAREMDQEKRLQCFTIDVNANDAKAEGMAMDLPYAKSVARHLDVDLHTIRVGPEMADQLSTMLYHLDEPQADPAPLNALFISHLAREHGIKVLLSGAGGDDIFSVYGSH